MWVMAERKRASLCWWASNYSAVAMGLASQQARSFPASRALSRQGKNERKERVSLILISSIFLPHFFLSLLSSHFSFPSSERREGVSLLPLIFASLSEISTSRPVRNEQRCCSTAEWLQEALQKSCKRAGCSSSKFWLFRAAVESPLAAVQKIPEARSALQSGCKVASKRQRMLLPVMAAYHSLVQKERNADCNNTIIMRHGKGVDKALVVE